MAGFGGWNVHSGPAWKRQNDRLGCDLCLFVIERWRWRIGVLRESGRAAASERYGEIKHRLNQFITVSAEGGWKINLFEWLSAIGATTEQIAGLLETVLEIAERGEKGGGKNDQFWKRASKQLTRNAVDLCRLATGKVDIRSLHKIITSAPSTHAQVQDPEWQAGSYNYQCILAADAKEKTPGELNDYELAATYFLNEFINFPPETRGSILATFSVCSDVFLRGTLGEIFGSETTNFCPEMSFEGAVIILDFPTRIYGQAGLLLQGAFKYCWQLAAERRDVKKNPRFAFMAIDEYQDIAAETDVAFFAVARSARICSLILTQSVAGLYAVFGGEVGKHRTDQMLQALSTHIYHACAGETAKYASELIAKEFQMRLNYNTRRGQGGGGGQQHLEAKVLEASFATLATGGPENNWIAEGIVFSAGRIWNATGDTYLRTAFKQIF